MAEMKRPANELNKKVDPNFQQRQDNRLLTLG